MSGEDPDKYLRASKTVEDAAGRAFEAKKWTWIPDDEEGFKAAVIKSQKGDRCVVELDNGQVTASSADLRVSSFNFSIFIMCLDVQALQTSCLLE